MLCQRTIAVVIPAYNEARHIDAVIRTVPSYVDRIYLVDDASLDDTVAIARALDDARLTVVRHATNRGVGAAIRSGYDAAFRDGADIAVVVAGDGQMDPADMEGLVRAVADGAAYAKGNRLQWPGARAKMPLSRWLGNVGLSWMTRRVSGLAVGDSQCGYTALGRDAASTLVLDRLWPRYGYPNDLLCQLAERALPVVDIPVRPIYADEQSGVTLRDALWVVPGVLARAWWRRVSGGVEQREAGTASAPMKEPAKAPTSKIVSESSDPLRGVDECVSVS